MIGDVLMSSILFESIKREYPNAELHYVLNSYTFPAVEHHPFIDKYHIVTDVMDKSSVALFELIKQLRREQFDVVIDAYGKISSLLITVFSGAKVKIGYQKYYTKLLYTHALERYTTSQKGDMLAVENRMLLLSKIGIDYKKITPKIYLQEKEKDNVKLLLEGFGINFNLPLYMISVLGSDMQKTYPFEYMASLLDNIIAKEPQAQLLFNYIPSQKKQAQEILSLCNKVTQNCVYFDVLGKSLREFMAITFCCDAMIGNEGGAVNMAKALDKDCFIVFSPQINKDSWFVETGSKHVAVHLSDYEKHGKEERELAKKDSFPFYKKLQPELIIPKLNAFLDNRKEG